MEPFGTLSAVLSLVDLLVRSSSAIHDLISQWKEVPVEVIALSSEINDSKLVSNEAGHIFQRNYNETLSQYASFAAAIEEQVERAKPMSCG